VQSDHRDPDDAEERAWRAIVANYGERVELDETAPDERSEPGPDPSGEPPVAGAGARIAGAPFGGRFGDPRLFPTPDADAQDRYLDDDDDEGFVPPPPPPIPRTTPDRLLAWVGLFGSPLVLLVALILSIPIPTLLGYALIGGFVGGFLYLVLQMPREPRDPWDDGAQV